MIGAAPSPTALQYVLRVYEGSDGEATRRLYAELEARGPIGLIVVNLLRACKTSERAKKYRGGNGHGSYRSQAYATKEWSMGNLCRVLGEQAGALGIVWGWQRDDGTPGYSWVLYVTLPAGQVSFHTASRGVGPLFPGEWDGARGTSVDRIIRWAAGLLG